MTATRRAWTLGPFLLAACSGPSGGQALDDAGTLHFPDSASDAKHTVTDDARADRSAPDGAVVPDAAQVAVQRGPVSLSLSGDPEGLWWDAASSTLYIADQENNQILTWTDAAGFKTWSVLPGGAQGGEDLGQIVLTPQGNLVVIVFGFGTNGAIDIVAPDGTAAVISGLDPTFRRLGLTQASDGTLYESYFSKASEASNAQGYVARLTLTSSGTGWSGTETTVVSGLGKPVGVLASGSSLYITDQATNDFYAVPIASLPSTTPVVLGSNLALDLISQGPNGSFFTGSSTGDLEELTAAGAETVFVSGYANPRGSAYDAAHDRVFFGNHITSSGNNQLVIVPGP